MFGLSMDLARINVKLNFVILEEVAIDRCIANPDRKTMASVNASKHLTQSWEGCVCSISFISNLVCRRELNESFPSIKIGTREIDVSK